MDRLLLILIIILGIGWSSCTEHTDSSDNNAIVPEDLPPAKAKVNYMLRPQAAGNISAASTPEALREMFGSEEVKDTVIYVGDGISRPGSLVFPGTADELQLVWTETPPRRPELLMISRANTQWRAANGLTVGTRLSELVRMNGENFSFAGFDWDFGGRVTDWQGGKLAGFNVRLGYPDGHKVPESMLGDQIISSDHPDVAKVPITVQQIILVLNRGRK